MWLGEEAGSDNVIMMGKHHRREKRYSRMKSWGKVPPLNREVCFFLGTREKGRKKGCLRMI